MKQIIQDLRSGKTLLAEIPVPKVAAGEVLIKTHRSLVSLGTERMLVDFGKANYIQKARQQPDKVKQVLQKIKTDGLQPTMDAVFRKLGEPLPLGYCNAGEVIAVGKGVKGFQIGDRVASNGHHAEVVRVPENLVAKIPDGVSFEDASFTVIGAIALQGIRLINPTFGETVVVTGLGLIGLIAVQLLKANGCRVIGFDYDPKKIDLAKRYGVEAYNAALTDVVKTVLTQTDGIGADAVLITASTKSNEVIHQSAQMCRKRGRVVLVGVIGLDLQRSDFFEKELTFQVSCSYGPGRYDSGYEQKGLDYPIGFVRWTEQRNFQAVLNALATGNLSVQELITARVPLEEYEKIYGNMDAKGAIASILIYEESLNPSEKSVVLSNKTFEGSNGVLGVIGAGNFTTSMIVPTLHKLGADIKYIVSSRGLSGTTLAKKYDIARSSTEMNDVLMDSDVDAVLITTRHNQHAEHVISALEAGKHVFVEKPLAIDLESLNRIEEVYQAGSESLLVGFNRRFAPLVEKAKHYLGDLSGPISVVATMNAGEIPADHWVQDMEVGGGRIIGEACHYIDLISFLVQDEVQSVSMHALGVQPDAGTDTATIVLKYKNGSLGVINYYANGHKSYPKERVEIYDNGRNMILDNFRKLWLFGYKNKKHKKKQDKGHYNQFDKWLNSVKMGGEPVIPFSSILNTSKAAILAIDSLKDNQEKSL